MWLLHTDKAVLRYFASPEDVPGGYAILSHIWDGTEEFFKDMTKLGPEDDMPNALLPIRLNEKTRNCCKIAFEHGFEWVWINSCCIDRSYTLERAKDLKATFLYFSFAQVCYVYLHDVSSRKHLSFSDTAFRKSAWHTNVWTLQELIAPPVVIFFSKEWTQFGTKQNLASPLLEQITGIPAQLLTFERHLKTYSVSARLSWAAPRHHDPKRLDAEGYSLSGIMGVDMDVVHGEGQNAFQRLQREILKQLKDTSVFVWGSKPVLSYRDLVHLVDDLPSVPVAHSHHADESYLFAPAHSAFKPGHASTPRLPVSSRLSITPVYHTHVANGTQIGNTDYALDTSPLSTFTITDSDVVAHLPIIEVQDQRVLVAFISCLTVDTRPLGLVLQRCPNSAGGVPLYDVGLDALDASGVYRLVTLETIEQVVRQKVTFTWRTIHIRGQHIHDPWRGLQHIPMNGALTSFYFPPPLLQSFGGRWLPPKPVIAGEKVSSSLGRRSSPVELADSSTTPHAVGASPRTFTSSPGLSPKTPSLPATFLLFADDNPKARRLPFLVHFGRCTENGDRTNGRSTNHGAYWANMHPYDLEESNTKLPDFEPHTQTHVCDEDHISSWTDQEKTFHIELKPFAYGISLSFSTKTFIRTTEVLVPEIKKSYQR